MMVTFIVSTITVVTVIATLGACCVLAWLYDHESAASTGCIDEGQVW